MKPYGFKECAYSAIYYYTMIEFLQSRVYSVELQSFSAYFVRAKPYEI